MNDECIMKCQELKRLANKNKELTEKNLYLQKANEDLKGIIRTISLTSERVVSEQLKGINRNIVECKAVREFRQRGFKVRINRNIVECKAALKKQCFNPIYVLIETLWNVKLFQTPMQPYSFRINRNIVECKEDFTVFQLQSGFCINRNIVECKGEFAIPHPKRACRINRNIVECKDKGRTETH